MQELHLRVVLPLLGQLERVVEVVEVGDVRRLLRDDAVNHALQSQQSVLQDQEEHELGGKRIVPHGRELEHRQTSVCDDGVSGDGLEDVQPGADARGALGRGPAGDADHAVGDQLVLHHVRDQRHHREGRVEDAEASEERKADGELHEVVDLGASEGVELVLGLSVPLGLHLQARVLRATRRHVDLLPHGVLVQGDRHQQEDNGGDDVDREVGREVVAKQVVAARHAARRGLPGRGRVATAEAVLRFVPVVAGGLVHVAELQVLQLVLRVCGTRPDVASNGLSVARAHERDALPDEGHEDEVPQGHEDLDARQLLGESVVRLLVRPRILQLHELGGQLGPHEVEHLDGQHGQHGPVRDEDAVLFVGLHGLLLFHLELVDDEDEEQDVADLHARHKALLDGQLVRALEADAVRGPIDEGRIPLLHSPALLVAR
mmetsp:Transcript_6346/g.16960  ORF Transcript_6346/g.16960 Transcript_6346/m.16960 type:complete len:432 (-) Transcript_6346:1068-2363(-)